MARIVANLEPELGNLHAALDWSIESKQFNAGATLLGALGHFLYILGLRSETWARCERLLACELSGPARAEVLFWAHNFSYYLDPSSTLRLAEELTALGRATGNGGWVARGLGGIGFVQMRAQPEAAVATYEEAIPLARATGQLSGSSSAGATRPTSWWSSAGSRVIWRLIRTVWSRKPKKDA